MSKIVIIYSTSWYLWCRLVREGLFNQLEIMLSVLHMNVFALCKVASLFRFLVHMYRLGTNQQHFEVTAQN